MGLEIVLLQEDLLAFSTLEFCHSFATFMNSPNMLKVVTPAGQAQTAIATLIHYYYLSLKLKEVKGTFSAREFFAQHYFHITYC
jgi:hypothetical protein